MKAWATALILCIILVLAAAGGVLSLTSTPVDQPIAFNHRLHVTDLGAECTDCHLYARTGVRATIPNFQACGVCHEVALGETQQEAVLIEHVESQTPIPWRKVYWLPEHVYFSHRRHTALAEIDCQVCHGAMKEREAPLSRRLVEISMEWCINCHQQRGASNDCISCHR